MFGRKGGTPESEVLTLIAISVAVMILVLMIPTMIENMASLFALGSSEAVARDLGGLVTIIGAAIDSASINYVGADEAIVYTVVIKDKLVTVEAFKVVNSDGVRTLERIGGIPAMEHGYSRIPFGIAASIEAKNEFTITKALFGDGTNYDIQVK
jgi:hypothetical protein